MKVLTVAWSRLLPNWNVPDMVDWTYYWSRK